MADKTVTIQARCTKPAGTFRRCGLIFGREFAEYAVTPDQLKRLKDEPAVMVKESAAAKKSSEKGEGEK